MDMPKKVEAEPMKPTVPPIPLKVEPIKAEPQVEFKPQGEPPKPQAIPPADTKH